MFSMGTANVLTDDIMQEKAAVGSIAFEMVWMSYSSRPIETRQQVGLL